jgi:upstream activation factor subunit UAF30
LNTGGREVTVCPMAKNTGLNKLVQPDEILADVIGSDRPLPRTQIVKKLWDYIKKHDLQDPDNRREIVADALLKPFFNGKRSVNMMKLASYISDHIEG